MTNPHETIPPEAEGAVPRPPGPTLPAQRTTSAYSTGTLSRSAPTAVPEADEEVLPR